MKALFTYDYGEEKMQKIKDLGYEIIIEHEKKIENNDEINSAEILVCYNPFDRLDIDKMKNLKLIVLSSIGFDQLPFEKLKGRDIIVTNNQGGYSKPMGEWIVSNILEIYKFKKYFYNKQQEKKWKLNTDVLEVVNRKVLFLGTGTIAKEGAKRLQGFELDVHGVNTSGHDAEYFDKTYRIDELFDIVGNYDIVISTLPKTDETYHIIDDKFMNLMKDNSVLINVSRGSIIDKKALVKYLEKDKFLGVSLDVFEEEPLPEEDPLWDYDNVYISPHNSWVSEMRNERRYDVILENLKRYMDNKELVNIINIKRGY